MQLVQNTNDRGGEENPARGTGRKYQGESKPTVFSGNGSEKQDWKIRIMAYLCLSLDKRMDEWMEWVQARREDIPEDAVDLQLEAGPGEINDFSSILYSELTRCCAGLACSTFGESNVLADWVR